VRLAAQKNHITQPAVTQQIQTLEEKLNCKLFERHNKKVYLTLSGKSFLVYAEKILQQYQEAKMKVEEINDRFCGSIRLATIYSIGLYELQPIVRKFLKCFPKIDIHLEYQPSEKIYDMIAKHEIDFGFVAYPASKHHVRGLTFAEETLVLAQSPHHRVLTKKHPTLKDLEKIRFVAFSANSPTRRAVDDFFQSKGCFPKILNEYDNVETLKSAMTLGIGCSIVPVTSIRHEVEEGSLEIVPIKEMDLKRPLGILHAKPKAFTKATRAFLDFVLKNK
jgi:DNA-binding transcriptional LysR family regulator